MPVIESHRSPGGFSVGSVENWDAPYADGCNLVNSLASESALGPIESQRKKHGQKTTQNIGSPPLYRIGTCFLRILPLVKIRTCLNRVS